MSEKEVFSQILTEFKKMNNTLEYLKNSLEANHEILIDKLSTIEGITDKSRRILDYIETNTTQ